MAEDLKQVAKEISELENKSEEEIYNILKTVVLLNSGVDKKEEKKPEWNLADEELMVYSGALVKIDEEFKGKGLFSTTDFKKFIQKVGEDIDKKVDKQISPYSKEYVDGLYYTKKIMDKRAGEL